MYSRVELTDALWAGLNNKLQPIRKRMVSKRLIIDNWLPYFITKRNALTKGVGNGAD
jgi:hypothetical protein